MLENTDDVVSVVAAKNIEKKVNRLENKSSDLIQSSPSHRVPPSCITISNVRSISTIFIDTGNLLSSDIQSVPQKFISPRRSLRTRHMCTICMKTFRNETSLERHTKLVHNDGMLLNNIGVTSIHKSKRVSDVGMEQGTENVEEINEKVDENDIPVSDIVVDQPEEAFSSTAKSFGDNPGDKVPSYSCDNCGKKFPSEIELNRHMKTYSKEYHAKSVCDVCNRKFASPYVMRRHRKLSHKDPFDEISWNGSTSTVAKSTTTATSTEHELESMVVLIDGKKYYHCNQCSYKCNGRSRMREHYRIHSGERPYTCEKCGRQFNNSTLLRNHLDNVHEGLKKFPCDICGNRFASKHYADEHRRIHTGEKPFVCDLCGSSYAHLTSLLTHQNKHNGIAKFKCQLCPLTFIYRGSYNLHRKRHTGELSYVCNDCGKAFIDKQHLTRHMAVHSDAKPHRCTVCGATFKLSKYLGSHKKVHRKKEKNHANKSSAALNDEKWDPLILPLQRTSSPSTTTDAGTTATYAEDRAKLVKSKKLGPLIHNYNGVEVAVLKCDHCTAFFIERKDFEKHRDLHGNDGGEIVVEEAYTITEYSEVDGSDGVAPNNTAAPIKVLSKKRPSSNSSGNTDCPKNWKKSGQRELRIKVGGNVVVKKTAKKLSFADKSPSKGNSIDANCSNAATVGSAAVSSSSQRRRSTKMVSYTEPDDSDGDEKKTTKRPFVNDEYETQVTKSKNSKKRKYSGVLECETSCLDEDEKLDRVTAEDSLIEEMIIPESAINKKTTRDRRSTSDGELKQKTTSDGEVRRRKSRLKRILRANDEEDEDKGQTIYTCAHCLRNFRRKSNLKRHMSKLHFGKGIDEAGDSSKWFTGYCCDICGEGLQVRSMMMAHRDVVHGKYPEIEWYKYQTSLARVKFCNECKKYFRGGKLFDEHGCDKGKSIVDEDLTRMMKEAEDVKPSFVCSFCNLCFKWKWDYRAHRENEHRDLPAIDWTSVKPVVLEFLCEKCFKAYPNETLLKTHQCSAVPQQSASDTVVKPFRCELCGNDYFWKSDFRRHMRTKHPKENYRPTEHDTIIYSCPYCEEKFSMKKRILHHMRKVHNIASDSPFVCVQCNKVFRRRDNLDRHNESYHPTLNDQEEANKILSGAEIKINGEIAYHCDVCNRNISNPNRYISHYRGHYSENKYTCDSCGKQAKTQHQLNTHIKNIHLNIRNYKCDICSKSFYTKQACEEHRRIHTGERPFSCEICGKTFVAGNALISHKRFHNDFYPHSCHMCPKKFKVRRSLINHIRTHTGERPFKCDLCTKTFNNSSQYSYHKKVTHSEARPFSCSICGNCFKANKFLTRHMELHTVRSQIQTRKSNNPAHYTTSQIKTSAAQSVTSTTMAVNHQTQSQMPLPHQQTRVSAIEQPVSSAPIMTAQIQPVQHVNPVPAYVKEATPSTLASSSPSTFRNDDLVATALYNLHRTGYEPNANEFVRSAPASECDINAINTAKRNFTAADAYMAAANYALSSEDYKPNPNTVDRPYNPTGQPPGNHNVAAGKHMTWL